jgi:hypothetical protein
LKSIKRYFPAKGNAGFGLTWQKISIRVPFPPANIAAVSLFIFVLLAVSLSKNPA